MATATATKPRTTIQAYRDRMAEREAQFRARLARERGIPDNEPIRRVHFGPGTTKTLYGVAVFSNASFAEVVAIGLTEKEADQRIAEAEVEAGITKAEKWPMLWELGVPAQSRCQVPYRRAAPIERERRSA